MEVDMEVSIREVEELLRYEFKNKKWLEDALTHSSYTANVSYQRLEFLGDNAIGLIVSSYIFKAFPDSDAGQMSLIRSANVSTEKLARVAVKHGLYKYLRHNATALVKLINDFVVAVEQEDRNQLYGGLVKAPKVLADIVESIAAAVYVDCGMNVEMLWVVFRRLMEPFITPDIVQQKPQPVTLLYEWCQKEGKQVDIRPKRKGDKTLMSIYVDGLLVASSSSKQKEHAKIKAANIAVDKLLAKSNISNAMDMKMDMGAQGDDKKRLKMEILDKKNMEDNEMGIQKKKLHELCDKKRWPRPTYKNEEAGPPHERRFKCKVRIEIGKHNLVMDGDEKSRVKDAESSAASAMLQALQFSNYISPN